MIKKLIYCITLLLCCNLTQTAFTGGMGRLRQLGQSGWQALRQQAPRQQALFRRSYQTSSPRARAQRLLTSPSVISPTSASRAWYQRIFPVLPFTAAPLLITSPRGPTQPDIRTYSTPSTPKEKEGWYHYFYHKLFGRATPQQATQEYLKNWYPNVFLKTFQDMETHGQAKAIVLQALNNKFFKDNPDLPEEGKKNIYEFLQPKIEYLEKVGKPLLHSKPYTSYLEEVMKEWEEGYQAAKGDPSWTHLMELRYTPGPFQLWLGHRKEIDRILGEHKNLDPKTPEGAKNLITKHIISSSVPPSELSEEERIDFLSYFLSKPLRMRVGAEGAEDRKKHRSDFSKSIKNLEPIEAITKVNKVIASPQRGFNLYDQPQTKWTFKQLLEDAAAQEFQKMSPKEREKIEVERAKFQSAEERKSEEIKRAREMAEGHFEDRGWTKEEIDNALGRHGKE